MSTTSGSTASANNVEEARSHLNSLTRLLEKEISDVGAARAKLEKDISEYEALKAQVSSVHNLPAIVSLNVGGTTFATAKENLMKEKGSLLEVMFTSMSVAPSPDGSYFIDRDPTAFRHILNYLRGGAPYVPPPGREFDELSAEIDFYRIASYKAALSLQATSPTYEFRYSLRLDMPNSSPQTASAIPCEPSPTAEAALASTALPSSSLASPPATETAQTSCTATPAEAVVAVSKEIAPSATVAPAPSAPVASDAPAAAAPAAVREFPFASIIAYDGIINWIGTEGGTKEFVNPITSGKIKVECTEGINWFGKAEYLTEKGKPTAHWKPTALPSGGGVCGSNKPSITNLWISMQLPFPVELTAWTAMHVTGCSTTLKHWELAGSNDGKTWTVIFTKENDSTLENAGSDGVYKLEKEEPKRDDKKKDEKEEKKVDGVKKEATGPAFYSYLRWCNTSNYSQQRYHCVHFYAMELYGRAQLPQ